MGGPSSYSSSSGALTFAAAPSAGNLNNNNHDNHMINKMNNGHGKHHLRRHLNNHTYNTQAHIKPPHSPARYCMSDIVAHARRQGGPDDQLQHQHQQQQHQMQQQMQMQHRQQQQDNQGQSKTKAPYRPFPIVSFNHMSREVLDYELSRDFYCGVLGFIEIPRPAFENEGVWLYGFGLSLHLIKSRYPQKRLLLKGRRIGT